MVCEESFNGTTIEGAVLGVVMFSRAFNSVAPAVSIG